MGVGRVDPGGPLQFGHSLTAVENVGGFGPHHYPELIASIWPQPYSRGEPPSPTCPRKQRLCGFNLATALQPWRTARRLPVSRDQSGGLQFGHSLTAVENRRRQRAREISGCVASIWPQPHSRGERRTASGRRDQSGGLQFGHSLTAVENRSSPSIAARVGERGASIWPQPHSRGERQKSNELLKAKKYAASIWPQPYSRGEPWALE